MKALFKISFQLALGAFLVVVDMVRLGIRGLTATLSIGYDLTRALVRHGRGVVRCPRGHAIAVTGGPFECSACGFVYEGTIFRCANPECHATTPYCNCPTCGLSVRSPFRFGRP